MNTNDQKILSARRFFAISTCRSSDGPYIAPHVVALSGAVRINQVTRNIRKASLFSPADAETILAMNPRYHALVAVQVVDASAHH